MLIQRGEFFPGWSRTVSPICQKIGFLFQSGILAIRNRLGSATIDSDRMILRIRGENGVISLPEKRPLADLMTRTKAPILLFPDVVALETYMSGEPARSTGFWLKLSKIGAAKATISKGEAVEAALCCGWIDGQLAKFDEHHFLVRMTPRRAGSRWSAKNRETAERLAREGRLKASGLEQIERAKADGRWDQAYQSQGKAEAPSDLLAALARNTKAKRFFETLDRSNRYAIIYRVSDAKLPRTRSRRIAQYVEMLARGETIRPAKARKPSRNEA